MLPLNQVPFIKKFPSLIKSCKTYLLLFVFRDVDATTDVPGVLIWFQIFKKFPNAKVNLLINFGFIIFEHRDFKVASSHTKTN